MTILAKSIRLINSRLLIQTCSNSISRKQKASYLSLAEVGRLETPKVDGNYQAGQLFLHRVFGYRGVILFQWEARVYDKDLPNKRTTKVIDEHGVEFSHVGKEIKGHSQTYYQVLMDLRDSPYVRTQTESVTFLSNQKNSKQLFAIPFLDYVSQSDILPYTNTDEKPIENELFDRFLIAETEDKSKFKPSDTLIKWMQKNHPWLKLSDVYKETTNDVQITCIPFYIGMRYSQNTTNYWWRYCIRIENLSDQSIKIKERQWTIYSLSGCLESMTGTGIGGQEQILSKYQPAFQYSSHVNIQQANSGHMSGHFKCEREDGETFIVKIPSFPLISNNSKATND